MGSIIVISSNNWLSCWIGLEINLISFIPFLYKITKFKSIEASLIYFLFQSFASLILLLSIILYLFLFNKFTQIFCKLLIISLLIKIGRAPFHFWVLLVIENLRWVKRLILITWQKIGPFILLIYCVNRKIILLFLFFCAFFRSIIGFNQNSLQKIIGYSSINHTSWILGRILLNKFIWINYYFFYSFILVRVIIIFYKINLFYLNQIFFVIKNYSLKLIIFFNILSIGGLPPFLGFFPKILVINNLIILNYYLITFTLIFFTLIVLFFYIRIIYVTLIINSLNSKINFFVNNNNNNNNIYYFRNLNNFGLIICIILI